MKKGEKGFTLVELLIIVAILGIIAAVAVPNVSKFITRSDETAEFEEVQVAITRMMETEDLDSLNNPVVADNATSDMAFFPDAQHPLFPDYLEERYMENEYWVKEYSEYTLHQE